MKYSYEWLKELSGTKLSLEKLAEVLTMRSLEVEKMEKTEEELENVVVGEVLQIKKHPNADKLQLTEINIGNNILNIVCGAHNIKIGDKVPVALVGAKLPNGLEIKEAEIRGEKSFGMLCALDELGLGKDHSGIIILDKKAKIGDLASKYLRKSDDKNKTLEIKVLPDRAHDAMCHVGLAREIAALENKKFSYDFEGLKLINKKSKKLTVKIEDKKLCSRYIGVVMEGIEIKDSPEWMKERLKMCGIKAINNVVDATNYVMLELGQPLHAFDFEKIKSENKNLKAEIIVRRARKNEELELLDDTKLKLSEDNLLITNGKTPLALAGIMGGKNSGINENTKIIILEAASFEAINIRRSRVKLNARTESSERFERSLDSNLAEKAMARIIEILEHTANGRVEGIIDAYPGKIKPWKVKLNLENANSLLGEEVPRVNVIKILNLLEIKTSGKGDNILAEIPTYRIDLQTQEDLIEEIGRVWGYDKIENQPILEFDFTPKTGKILSFVRNIKKFLVNVGFDEVYNYSFYSKQDMENCALDDVKHFELANPMNPDQQFVRVSLIPNLLKNIKNNLGQFENFRIFEIGKSYYPNNSKIEEKRMLEMAIVLNKESAKYGASKNAETFYSLKGAVEDVLENLGIREEQVTFNKVELPKKHLGHPERSAEIVVNNEKVGYIGEINPLVLNNYKITKRVAVAEFDLDKLLKVSQKEIVYKQLQKFPTITRDISLLAKGETKAADIKNLIIKIGGKLVLNVEMFDVFFKDKQTSFAYHIEFGASDRTLENKEVDEVMGKIVAGLEKELGLEIRK